MRFFKNKTCSKKISWNNNRFGVLPVHCCSNCGFLFQNPRFSKKFYMEYYKNSYRNITLKTLTPPKRYLEDQKYRGKKLYEFLNHLSQKRFNVRCRFLSWTDDVAVFK